jgi:hypothetical protein
MLSDEFGQYGAGCFIDREECFQAQFGDGDVGGGTEVGECGDQPQFPVIRATCTQVQRHREAEVMRPELPWAWRREVDQFLDEAVETVARIAHALGPHPVAKGLGFDRLVLEARGHEELELRVTRAYEEFIAPGTFVFRSCGDGDRLHDVVTFRWEMVYREGGGVAGVGLEILVLGADGRIVSDYQFIEG